MAKPRRAVVPQRVVGIGASAGGLEALKQLVMRLPVDTGLAFVVLQHLPPSQVGQLAQLLANWATLPVIDVRQGHRVEPNTILVVPPQTSAALSRGVLVLRKTPGTRPRLPIDGLMTSLARVLDKRAIGVVLSGTAHDGTEGLRAIRAAGGITVAQDPSTAQFDEMPRSAIAAGVTDLVLAPAQIGEQLGALAGRARPARVVPEQAGIEPILEQLREASGVDFTSYKRTTIERRLERRMAKLHLATFEDYRGYLAVNPAECSILYDDLLIHVTEFFRDRPVFDRLAADILPDLIRAKAAGAPVRVWVPGCATGEEVYSLAMVLLELLGAKGELQMFGTDLSERAIEIARRGFYPDSIAAQVGPERLQRFFRREDGGYRIRTEVRERCVFVRHDLTNDPPFSKLDLISCRNVLIYLGAALQRRVLAILHYALDQPGYLVLGRAETVAGFETMFATIDAEARIYTRKQTARAALHFPIGMRPDRSPRTARDALQVAFDIQRDLDHVLLARYAPACVLVDEQLDVVQFRGHTGSYLESPAGHPQLNVVRMAREGLGSELTLAVQRARRTDAPVRQERVMVRDGNRERAIHLEVVPLRGGVEAKRYFLIVFEEATSKPPIAPRRTVTTKRGRESAELARLRQELAATKEYLRSLVTQHAALSDELGIANEELQSTNEELQSSNEELQTAKEELQSANEELETVNDELQRGNEQLRAVNDDLVNVLASVEIAIIIVDAERKIRRFTPRARSVMKLLPTDLGRPIADLHVDLIAPDLDATIAEVITSLAVHDAEVRDPGGTYYRMQIRPYRTVDQVIGGAVVAFVDITALRAAREHAAAVVEAVPTPLVVLDDRLCVLSANAAFHRMFRSAGVIGQPLLAIGVWTAPDLATRLADAVGEGTGFDDVELEHRDAAGSRILRLAARGVEGSRAIVVGIADVSEARQVEAIRAAAVRERDQFLDAVSHELRTPLSAILLWAHALSDLRLDDPRRTQAIAAITDSARSEAQLVDDLLELALSRSGRLTVKPDLIDPSVILTAAIDEAKAGAAEKNIAFHTQLAPGPKLRADPRRLRQIASGLIGNAIKFTSPGGRIWVELGRADGALDLTVRDDGPGIAPEFLTRAFEPFEQADQSSTRAHRGLGIGLALVRHLVERHGGEIGVASDGTRGTTFTVHLPAT